MTSIFDGKSAEDRALLDLVSQSLQQPKVVLGDKPVPPPASDVNNAKTLADLANAVQFKQPTSNLTADQQAYVDGIENDE